MKVFSYLNRLSFVKYCSDKYIFIFAFRYHFLLPRFYCYGTDYINNTNMCRTSTPTPSDTLSDGTLYITDSKLPLHSSFNEFINL